MAGGEPLGAQDGAMPGSDWVTAACGRMGKVPQICRSSRSIRPSRAST